ncbi:thiamine pyrophosphate-dependent enzyme [Methanoregula sp. UBA64]|uniref:thiamine pyrophosphate-dependent enzyme n=1 Tax=Methanoregula sp. UBA64 TaxID=1915554 RepID=UPI0025CF1474|nr:thiamine pyrophosphate-dependent enzyme [Methanoregula sp. UBA64]
MKGTQALAEALRAATDRVYTVPGYPVTELGELAGAEMVINEKTALEYALGDSLSGRRAAVIVKNVGVNACADPLCEATVQGLVGGVILVAGDDPKAKGSQTAQDSRYYGELAEIPVIEPDESSWYAGVEAALAASESFSRVAMIRLTPEVLESEANGHPLPRGDLKGRLADPGWTVHGRVMAAASLFRSMQDWSTSSPLNRWTEGSIGAGPAPGAGRVVTVYPPPARLAGAGIHEYGRPFVRDHRAATLPDDPGQPESRKGRGYYRTFCRECPFRPLLALLKSREMQAVCDAGCSVYGLNPPYEIGVASYGMGSSIAVAARSTRVALIGDYGLLHSGLPSLIDVYEKRLPLLCIVMKNHCAAMTGRQPAFDPVPYLDWALPVICRAEDESRLREVIRPADKPTTIVVEANCPKGARYETVEC